MSGSALHISRLSLLSNIVLAIVKWVAGILGNSYALIADAIESTSDIFASLLVLAGIRYSSKPADKNHPYGHGRAESLVTFLVVVFLLISAFVIAWHSIQNIRVPHEAPVALPYGSWEVSLPGKKLPTAGLFTMPPEPTAPPYRRKHGTTVQMPSPPLPLLWAFLSP